MHVKLKQFKTDYEAKLNSLTEYKQREELRRDVEGWIDQLHVMLKNYVPTPVEARTGELEPVNEVAEPTAPEAPEETPTPDGTTLVSSEGQVPTEGGPAEQVEGDPDITEADTEVGTAGEQEPEGSHNPEPGTETEGQSETPPAQPEQPSAEDGPDGQSPR